MDTATVEVAPAKSNKPKQKRLTNEDLARALNMHKGGMSQTAIAKQLGVTQSAISQWLAQCEDSTDSAKLYLRGSALRMAKNIVAKGRASDHVKALEGLSVLSPVVSSGLTVMIGVQSDAVSISLSPPRAELTSESTADH